MTEDFKQKLTDYLVNNVTKTEPTPKTIFDYYGEVEWSVWENYLPNYSEIDLKGSIIDNVSNKVIVYGDYTVSDLSKKGIIIVLDGTLTPIKTFLSYSNGTELNPIQCMKQAEDGTYYLVDKATNLRFVMVNNFSQPNTNGEYVLNFRTSYNFDSSFNDYTVVEMYKSGTSADYLFFSKYVSGMTGNIKVTQFKINVGSTNEWSTTTLTGRRYLGSYVFFNDDGVYWRLLTTLHLGQFDLRCYTKNYSDESPTETTLYTFSSYPAISSSPGQCVFLNQNTVYFVLHSTNTYIGFYKYDFVATTLTTLYYKDLQEAETDETISLTISNATLYVQYVTNSDGMNYGDYYWQRWTEDVWNPVFYSIGRFVLDKFLLISKTDFNLFQICSLLLPDYKPVESLMVGYILLGADIYNPLNYNGLPYTDYNSMLPEQSAIYSNDALVFARDILNKTVIENKTISTVLVPNTYLNNISLVLETLTSETGNLMVRQTTPITKNIYEAVYLNFVNNITSKGILEDSGDSIDLTINSDTNSYVTENINTGTEENCQDTSMGWLVVNYSDGTTMTNSIAWELDDSDEYKYTYTFALDVQKEIASYEIKSYDMQKTYYAAINNTYPTQLEVGNIYTITQSVSVS